MSLSFCVDCGVSSSNEPIQFVDGKGRCGQCWAKRAVRLDADLATARATLEERQRELDAANEALRTLNHDLAGMATKRDVLQRDLDAARAEVVAAAGELAVDIREAMPGSTVARLLVANRLLIAKVAASAPAAPTQAVIDAAVTFAASVRAFRAAIEKRVDEEAPMQELLGAIADRGRLVDEQEAALQVLLIALERLDAAHPRTGGDNG